MSILTRWFIGSDDSGHEYVVPFERCDDWYAWLAAGAEDEEVSWTVPDYAHRIDGGLTFALPELQGTPIS